MRLCARAGSLSALRPGTILIAQPDQYDHFMHEAVILVHEHSERGSRGLLLNRETPFTMGEMVDGLGSFSTSLVYRGGGAGPDTVLMLHRRREVRGAKAIGDSGLFLGGLKDAQQLVDSGEVEIGDFKFFFNMEIWGPGELEKQFEQNVWLMSNDVRPEEIFAAKGDYTLHSRFKRRISLA